ncbi:MULTISPECIES: UDP-N-acetylglucosamine 1-carboxyvinyltransferase [Paenarthrobacter]|uniref:UDP-N-acetylglucosamine 1-carboxyvinyltransferase n=1 Tax=Paenarthrobacter ureafaciens TaxID=37931 RepID=A0AAX3EGT8_PAEUR|nr:MULTISPECIES: UDP-N-acetylglucosamine 1-carboxyvinyltransferase [Paenarthrobacter]MDO5866342.1 UDP-N-acetylglucosamine 1-carboxyvinyltransferase [Paenarthrobacter sp. SD-2]MDO5877441.1 UDP-N-acetylglucosamine 1-carboxyvinyltransferase [Paenarthrobacter sp. SD-1]UYV92631.1 UDP-N-acetylglucosamine 1-carboxyvinyltransferase [Paenarthrobacter ureafaciens]UYV97166.1 UDP-N-acetylglucosamine 1-carboxyvinyltransferase [Paenarthrobacter ureafaciens]
MTQPTAEHVGLLLRDARSEKGWTQGQLAAELGTSQSAVARMEQGKQNLSLRMIERLEAIFGRSIVKVGRPQMTHLWVEGGRTLSGAVDVNSSKNAGVALLCASLINRGTTTLRRLARIEEVNRIVEVLTSIGVECTWLNNSDLRIRRPEVLDLGTMDVDAARRTRSVIMLLGPLLDETDEYLLPYAGGCDLGTRTVEPHMQALREFGLRVEAKSGFYSVAAPPADGEDRSFVLTERGDTVTENAIMAAAHREGTTVIRNASPNYMVQDLCFYLQGLGVGIEGIGTTTLRITGRSSIDVDIEYFPSEDPIEAMSLITAGIVTNSEVTIRRVPIEFMEIELATLQQMGQELEISGEYKARNGRTRLVDVTTKPSELRAPQDKIHPMPFPGLNIDNLPFFAVIAGNAEGQTMIHDWVYENRAIYLTELNKLGAQVQLLDPHRIYVNGPTKWRAAEIGCPPALRPAACLLLAMLAARGTSELRNIYVIERGYEDLAERLNTIGAKVEYFQD